jgi:cell wall-associated NlpC family hydrolase
MSIAQAQVVTFARSKVGTVETGGADGHSGNIVPFWDWWKSATGENYQGASWCGAFVSWAFAHAKVSPLIAAKNSHGFIYCPDGVNFFKARKAFLPPAQAQSGDVVFFDWEGKGISDHVGIVVHNKGHYLVTVEGNTSPEHATGSQQNGGGVYLRNRPFMPQVIGVGRPNWKK